MCPGVSAVTRVRAQCLQTVVHFKQRMNLSRISRLEPFESDSKSVDPRDGRCSAVSLLALDRPTAIGPQIYPVGKG